MAEEVETLYFKQSSLAQYLMEQDDHDLDEVPGEEEAVGDHLAGGDLYQGPKSSSEISDRLPEGFLHEEEDSLPMPNDELENLNELEEKRPDEPAALKKPPPKELPKSLFLDDPDCIKIPHLRPKADSYQAEQPSSDGVFGLIERGLLFFLKSFHILLTVLLHQGTVPFAEDDFLEGELETQLEAWIQKTIDGIIVLDEIPSVATLDDLKTQGLHERTWRILRVIPINLNLWAETVDHLPLLGHLAVAEGTIFILMLAMFTISFLCLIGGSPFAAMFQMYPMWRLHLKGKHAWQFHSKLISRLRAINSILKKSDKIRRELSKLERVHEELIFICKSLEASRGSASKEVKDMKKQESELQSDILKFACSFVSAIRSKPFEVEEDQPWRQLRVHLHNQMAVADVQLKNAKLKRLSHEHLLLLEQQISALLKDILLNLDMKATEEMAIDSLKEQSKPIHSSYSSDLIDLQKLLKGLQMSVGVIQRQLNKSLTTSKAGDLKHHYKKLEQDFLSATTLYKRCQTLFEEENIEEFKANNRHRLKDLKERAEESREGEPSEEEKELGVPLAPPPEPKTEVFENFEVLPKVEKPKQKLADIPRGPTIHFSFMDELKMKLRDREAQILEKEQLVFKEFDAQAGKFVSISKEERDVKEQLRAKELERIEAKKKEEEAAIKKALEVRPMRRNPFLEEMSKIQASRGLNEKQKVQDKGQHPLGGLGEEPEGRLGGGIKEELFGLPQPNDSDEEVFT